MEIDQLDFGQDSAESEQDILRYIFLSTSIYKRLMSTKKWLVLGRKGTGKTAMCRMFFEQNKKQKQISLLSPKSLLPSEAALLDKASINKGESAIQKWKLVFLLEASRYIMLWASEKFGKNYIKWAKPLQKVRSFLISHDESHAGQIDKTLKVVRSISKVAFKVLNVEGSLEIDRQTQNGNTLSDDIDEMFPLIREAAKLCNNDTIYFLVDQVDDLWDSSENGQALIIGLLLAAKEINDSLGFVKTILFLRSDIFGYLSFPNSDHFHSLTEYLEWDLDSLKNLITLRIHKSTKQRGNAQELWQSVFQPTIDGIDSFEFIVQYTLMRPRDLIQLCNVCKDIAQNNGSKQIAHADVMSAIKKYSSWKSEDLISEYFVQYPYLEKILIGIFYASPSYEINREKIEQLLNSFKNDLIRQYGSKNFEPIDILLQSLYSIGFLGAVHHNHILYESLGDKVIIPNANLFHVHRAFRSALRIPDGYRDSKSSILEIPALATTAFTVLQPYLPVIATKGAEKLGDARLIDLWITIKKKFDTKATAEEALTDLLKSPDNYDLQAAFRVYLRKLLETDSDFAASLSKLLKSAGSNYKGEVIGDGAIAQGAGASAVGAGGIMIGGNVSGGIITGGKKKG